MNLRNLSAPLSQKETSSAIASGAYASEAFWRRDCQLPNAGSTRRRYQRSGVTRISNRYLAVFVHAWEKYGTMNGKSLFDCIWTVVICVHVVLGSATGGQISLLDRSNLGRPRCVTTATGMLKDITYTACVQQRVFCIAGRECHRKGGVP